MLFEHGRHDHPEEGRFLYLIARANNAKRIVEFGCSFGISTVYLAAAARENRGSVLTTEFEPMKVAGARENLSSAGLADVVTVLEGNALETLQNIEGPIDLLFLDGMKHLYLSVLELLRQRLRLGAVILADNVDMPSARPYANVVRSPRSGFVSSTLFGGRMELSLWNGNAT
jgi:predicted O-methyltransferase YrrM